METKISRRRFKLSRVQVTVDYIAVDAGKIYFGSS